MNLTKLPFHMVLSYLGKKTLRPGGLKATNECYRFLDIKDKHLLEVACHKGQGTYDNYIKYKPTKITATDNDKNCINTAKHKYTNLIKKGNLEFFCDNILNSKLNGHFDCIVNEAMIAMLPIELKLKVLDTFFAKIKPGGKIAIHDLILSEPNDKLVLDLQKMINVKACPLYYKDYLKLFDKYKNKIASIEFTKGNFALLNPISVLKDEKLNVFHVLKNFSKLDKQSKKRILSVKKFFSKNKKKLNYIVVKITTK